MGIQFFTLSLKIAHFIEWQWSICSNRSLKKSNHERISQVAHNKRATLSESLLISFLKSDVSDLLVIPGNCFKKSSNLLKKPIFLICFWQFTVFPLLYAHCPRENCPHGSLRSHPFLKSDRSNALLSLFKIEQPWANRFHRSVQKSDSEWFAHAAHEKRAMGAISSFSRANFSFDHKKRGICSKNRWANSQPWLNVKLIK